MIPLFEKGAICRRTTLGRRGLPRAGVFSRAANQITLLKQRNSETESENRRSALPSLCSFTVNSPRRARHAIALSVYAYDAGLYRAFSVPSVEVLPPVQICCAFARSHYVTLQFVRILPVPRPLRSEFVRLVHTPYRRALRCPPLLTAADRIPFVPARQKNEKRGRSRKSSARAGEA